MRVNATETVDTATSTYHKEGSLGYTGGCVYRKSNNEWGNGRVRKSSRARASNSIY